MISTIDRQSPDIAQGVSSAFEARAAGSGDELDVAGAGDQGMMFGYACDETAELMPLPIALAHRLAERLALVRKDGTLGYLRPDGKTQVSVRYQDGRPVGVEKLLISTQHAESVDSDTQIKGDLWEHVVVPVLPEELYDPKTPAPGFSRQSDGPVRDRRSDGRLRADRAQDHRRHLRRDGPPRRRRVQRQRPLQGRPLRRLRRALGGQELRRRRPRDAPARSRSPMRSVSRTPSR